MVTTVEKLPTRQIESTVHQKGIETWEKIYQDEVFKGPSAYLPINRFTYAAFERKLMPNGKWSLLTEAAEIRYFAQQNPKQLPLPMDEVDFEQISQEIQRPVKRIREVTALMAEFELLAHTKTKTPSHLLRRSLYLLP